MGAERGSETRADVVRRRVLVAGGLVVGLLLVAIGIDLGTASPSLCASCHEMVPRTELWTRSAHSEVACVKCHQAPTRWHALPQRLIGRAQLLRRDVTAHMWGEYADPVDSRAPGNAPVQDDVCLQCHDANRKATSGFRILINHAEHAKRNGSCVSCHVRTAHPLEARGGAMSLMSQCFTCHGTAEKPKASAECGVCHPADYELLPESHKAAKWEKTEHGVASTSDSEQCSMCHKKSFCENCHGLPMPHPDGWEKGATGHAASAQANRAVCERCHGSRPDMCTMCHHDAYVPSQGTWAKQHFVDVKQRGAARCFECHSPVFCVTCHAR